MGESGQDCMLHGTAYATVYATDYGVNNATVRLTMESTQCDCATVYATVYGVKTTRLSMGLSMESTRDCLCQLPKGSQFLLSLLNIAIHQGVLSFLSTCFFPCLSKLLERMGKISKICSPFRVSGPRGVLGR